MSNNQHSVINYAADYAVIFEDRSLIDKAYVDKNIIVTATAGMNLSSGRIVYIVAGKAYYYDVMDQSIAGLTIGITQTAALTDTDVIIQFSGVFDQTGLGLTADQKYFAGVNGTLTTNLAGLKIVQQIGVSLDTNRLAMHFYSPCITV